MPTKDQVDNLLSQFPGPITLRPRRERILLLFVGCIALMGGSVLLVRLGRIEGWICLAVFGAVAVLAMLTLLFPATNFLKLDGECFETSGPFWYRRVPWRNASGFEAVIAAGSEGNAARIVMYDDASRKDRFLAQLCARMYGRNTSLGGGLEKLSQEEMAMLMSKWRERALSLASPLRPA